MAAQKKKQQKKKKSDPLQEVLLKVEKSGDTGFPLCAPIKLKSKVNAHKYSASGKLTTKDKLRKLNIFDYVEKVDEQSWKVPAGKNKTKNVKVEYYKLSSYGKAYLKEQRQKEQQEKKKKLATVDGLKEVVEANKQQAHEVSESFQKLQQEGPEKITNLIETQMQSLQQAMKEDLGQVESKIAEMMGALLGEVRSLDKKFSEECGEQIIEKIDQEWQKQHSQLEQVGSAVKEHLEQEKFLTEALEENVNQQREKVLQEFSSSLNPSPASSNKDNHSRGKIVKQIFSALRSDKLQEIPDVYQKVKQNGVDITPGHFNDILWDLFQQGKVLLETWDRSLAHLKQRQHAIFRDEIFFYVKKL